jgi:hypothetical protein
MVTVRRFSALDGELDGAILQREQGVILAHADIVARVEFGAALANDDVASRTSLTAVALDARGVWILNRDRYVNCRQLSCVP